MNARLAFLALLSCLGNPLLACTCAFPKMPPADYGASVVFRGTVTDRQTLVARPEMRGRKRYAITLRVDESWKGSVQRSVVIYGLDEGTDCMGGSRLEVGKNYLVFASEQPSVDVLRPGSKEPWFSWADVLPKGTPVLMLTACAPTGQTSEPYVIQALKRLGKATSPPGEVK